MRCEPVALFSFYFIGYLHTQGQTVIGTKQQDDILALTKEMRDYAQHGGRQQIRLEDILFVNGWNKLIIIADRDSPFHTAVRYDLAVTGAIAHQITSDRDDSFC